MDDKISEMQELLSVFAMDVRTQVKIRNVLIHLKKNSKTVDDFIEYANAMDEMHRKQIAENEKRQAEQKANSLPCPECALPMALRPVNIDASTQTGDNSNSVWICMNKKCMYLEYSEKTVEQWRDELKRRNQDGDL